MATTALSLPRFTRLARAMEVTTAVGIALVLVLAVLGAFIPDWLRNITLAKLGQAGATLPITPEGRTAACVVLAVPIGVMLYGLFAVRRMFGEFARGRIFTEQTARQLQIFAATVLAQAPLGPLTSAALSVALTFNSPPGARALMVAFSINDYFTLIVGGVLLATATIMREAARLAEENASFV